MFNITLVTEKCFYTFIVRQTARTTAKFIVEISDRETQDKTEEIQDLGIFVKSEEQYHDLINAWLLSNSLPSMSNITTYEQHWQELMSYVPTHENG